jgi:hypothetical protein
MGVEIFEPEYTAREYVTTITFVYTGMGVESGWCVLGLSPVPKG